MYKYDSAVQLLFLFSLLVFVFSSLFCLPSFVTGLSFNYSSCCFCGTLRLPLRRTAATGLPALGSRLCTFFSRCQFGSEKVFKLKEMIAWPRFDRSGEATLAAKTRTRNCKSDKRLMRNALQRPIWMPCFILRNSCLRPLGD